MTLDELEDEEICEDTLETFITDLYKQKKVDALKKKQDEIVSNTTYQPTLLKGPRNMTNLASVTKTGLEGVKPDLEIESEMCKLHYLAQLLGIPSEKLLSVAAALSAKSGYFEEAISIAR